MAQVRVSLGRDGMTAAAAVFAIGEDTRPSSKGEILAALAAEGVVHGIDEKAVETLANAPFGTRMEVARGTPREAGSDSSIKYKIRLSKRAPLELDDGRVDYKELEIVKNVVKGQVLAEKIPCVLGRAGKDVKGREIPPQKVTDLALPAGKNTVTTPDGTRLISTMDGHVEIERGKIHVLDVFTLKTSVDLRTGNINCIGSAEIRGQVTDGFKVVAGKNIHILGLVEGARIESHAGEIRIDHGVQGHIKGYLGAATRISAKFIENVQVECGGDVLVREHIFHARIRSKGIVRTLEKPGVILGGEIYAERGVHCIDLGGEANPKTVVFLGPWRMAEIAARLVEIEKVLSELAAKESQGGESAEAMAERKAPLEREKAALEKEAEEIEKRVAKAEAPTLAIEGTMYSGVVVRALPDFEFAPREAKRRFRLTATQKGLKVGVL